MKVHELFAVLRVKDAGRAIAYYKEAFGAKEKFRLVEPSGRIGHAELEFGSYTVMLSDEYPELGIRGPEAVGATTVTIHLHVDDADAALRRAKDCGGTVVREAADHFY